MSRAALFLLSLALAAPGLVAAATTTTTATTPIEDPRETALREGMHLPAGYAVRYADGSGKAISFEQFMAVAGKGGEFSKDTRPDQRLIVLKLKAAGAPPSPAPTAPRVGAAVPAIALRDLDGKTVNAASFLGHVTLVNYFFADCEPCSREVPALNAYRARKDAVATLAVTFDDAATARAFVKARGLQWPVASDGQRWLDALSLKTAPWMVLVDAQGKVIASAPSSEIAGVAHSLGPDTLAAWVAKQRAGKR